jgi:hypothetical protein
MARKACAAQFNLRFGDLVCEFLYFSACIFPGNLARERFHILQQNWVGMNGPAQTVAKRILQHEVKKPRKRRTPKRLTEQSPKGETIESVLARLQGRTV